MSESPATFPIVGVGASVGGVEAFGELLREVPAGTGLAFVFVQHPDSTRPSDPTATLARTTSFPVLEVQEGMRVQPEHVYVVPSHAEVGIRKRTLALFPRSADERKPYLPIDFFFKGLAADLGNQAIGVVLSGTGSDGAEGVRAIKAEDGVTFAQDPGSAAFGAMPQAAVATGAVDVCLPVPEIAREIQRIGRHPARDARPVSSLTAWARAAAAPDLVRRTQSLLLHHYAPPGVIVNGRMQILHFQGRTEPFLDPVPGQSQYDLLSIARRGLVADLRVGIARARKTQAIVRQAGVRVEQDGSTRTCDVLVAPISSPPESPDDVFAVFFEEPPRAPEPGDLAQLDEDLSTTRDYLRWKVDEHRRANEQLLLVNTQIISRNEELQCLYAEVQAAKEQIQTTNDELAALNQQTQAQLGAAEWARDHAKATVEAVPVPLVVLTETLEIASANRAFEEQYGTAPVVVSGLLDNPRLRSALEGVRQRNESFLGLEMDCELPRLGKRCLSLSARFVPMPDTGRLILLAIEDVTARRRGEAERAQLLRESQAAKASAEEANRAKDIFLATLSHELRTPLSTLLLSAELLRTGQLSEDKVRKVVDSITRATKAQAQLIEDLLDISRIVTGQLKMELRTVDLATCVQAAVDAATPAAEMKHLAMEVDLAASLAPVPGDPARLQQVVWNLLANAVKFTPEGGRVRLTVDAAEGCGRIRVTDTGVGIDAAFVPHLFDRFSQEDRGQTRAHGGLGLGLAIVRHLVDAHGGSVHAESAGKGMGSTFTVLLPLMKASERRRYGNGHGTPAGETTVSIKGARILVVEDDPGTRETLTEMLSLNGADVRAAASAAVAMDIFGAFRPELLVCDIAMPDEDGYSLIGRIRALGRDRGGQVPAVAITALAAAEDRQDALGAGFDRHLAKPVDVDRLLVALSRLLPTAATSSAAADRYTPDA